MKYYKKGSEVFAFENDGSQDEYITQDMVRMPDIAGGSAGFHQLTITVPSTQTYKLETTNLLYSWAELR